VGEGEWEGKTSDGLKGQAGGEKVGLTFLRTLLVTLGRGMGALTSPISICHVHEVCQEARIEKVVGSPSRPGQDDSPRRQGSTLI
jgi:hypothetical protein